MLMLFMDFFVNDFHWDVSDTSWFQPMTLGRFFGPWVRWRCWGVDVFTRASEDDSIMLAEGIQNMN
jgi:hypothetical protein